MGNDIERGEYNEKWDRRMLRYGTGVKWQDKISSAEMRLKKIQAKIRQKRLQRFGHVRWEGGKRVLKMAEKKEHSKKTKDRMKKCSIDT